MSRNDIEGLSCSNNDGSQSRISANFDLIVKLFSEDFFVYSTWTNL